MENPKHIKFTFFSGLISGLLVCLYLFLLYQLDKNLLFSGYEKLFWVFTSFFMIFSIQYQRKHFFEHFIGFRDALKIVFRIFIISFILKFVFVYLLFNFIDNELIQISKQQAIDIFIQYKNPEIPDHLFKEQVAAFSKGNFAPTFFEIGLFFEIMAGFILSALISFIYKREKPSLHES